MSHHPSLPPSFPPSHRRTEVSYFEGTSGGKGGSSSVAEEEDGKGLELRREGRREGGRERERENEWGI